MDGNESFPLVVLPAEHGSLVPVATELVVDLDSTDDFAPDLRAVLAFLWGGFCQLATLFFMALVLLRRLRLQVIELRLQEHWAGLTVFVDHPEVPMDNNEAERRQRGPVVARKNFYGSGSLWSGRLAAMLFSLFQTLQVWGMDTGKWLTAYLSASAKAGGAPPPDPHRYLPWNMTAQERENLSVAKPKPPDPKPPDTNTPHTAEQ
jgi:hypothetical protein